MRVVLVLSILVCMAHGLTAHKKRDPEPQGSTGWWGFSWEAPSDVPGGKPDFAEKMKDVFEFIRAKQAAVAQKVSENQFTQAGVALVSTYLTYQAMRETWTAAYTAYETKSGFTLDKADEWKDDFDNWEQTKNQLLSERWDQEPTGSARREHLTRLIQAINAHTNLGRGAMAKLQVLQKKLNKKLEESQATQREARGDRNFDLGATAVHGLLAVATHAVPIWGQVNMVGTAGWAVAAVCRQIVAYKEGTVQADLNCELKAAKDAETKYLAFVSSLQTREIELLSFKADLSEALLQVSECMRAGTACNSKVVDLTNELRNAKDENAKLTAIVENLKAVFNKVAIENANLVNLLAECQGEVCNVVKLLFGPKNY